VAAGYLPQPILENAPAAGVTRLDNYVVRLKRGLPISGRILYHDGTPAANASVFLVGGVPTTIGDGKAWRRMGPEQMEDKTVTKTIADADGRFTLSGGGDAKTIVVSAPRLDFWEVPAPKDAAAKNSDFTIKLPAPGRLVVKYDIPGGDAKAKLFLQMSASDSAISSAADYTPGALVANKGEVTIGNLPPGKYYLDRPKRIAWGTYYCDRRLITIESGKTLESDFIRDRGTAVVGQVLGLKDKMRASVSGAADTAGVLISVRPAEARGNFLDGRNLPTFDIMMCGLDGRFKTEQLLPGKYAIIVEAWLPETPQERRKHRNPSPGVRRPHGCNRARERRAAASDGRAEAARGYTAGETGQRRCRDNCRIASTEFRDVFCGTGGSSKV